MSYISVIFQFVTKTIVNILYPYLKWFLSWEDSVADLALDTTGWAGTLVDEMGYHVGSGSAPFTVVTFGPTTLTFGRIVWSLVSETTRCQKWSVSATRRWFGSFVSVETHGPECCPTRSPWINTINVWWGKSGLGRARKQISDGARWSGMIVWRQHFEISTQIPANPLF